MASGHQFMIVGMRLANALYCQEITPIQWAEVVAHVYGGRWLRFPVAKNLMREMAEIPGFAEYCERLIQKYVE